MDPFECLRAGFPTINRNSIDFGNLWWFVDGGVSCLSGLIVMSVVVSLLTFAMEITQKAFRRFVVAHPPGPAQAAEHDVTHETKTAKDVMTPIESTFLVPLDSKLDWELIAEILAKGYSRVPVYSMSPGNIIGMLQTETLIKLWGPEANTLLMSLPISVMPRVRADTPLGEIFIRFKKQGIRMATVVKVISKDEGPLTKAQEELEISVGRAIGIITFQDVIKEFLLNDKPVIAKLLGETK